LTTTIAQGLRKLTTQAALVINHNHRIQSTTPEVQMKHVKVKQKRDGSTW
jgi:hypothetical protein